MSTAIAKNFQVGSDGTATNNFTIRQPATPDGTVRIANGNSGTTTDLVTVTSAGNVGIGTSSPGAKLDVTGTAAISGAVTLSGGTANGVAYLNGSKVLTTGSALTFDGTRLGVNIASPTLTLEVGGNAATGYMHSGVGVLSIGSKTNFPVGFDVNNTERMRLDSSGNLGLGVTPSAWSSSAKALEIGIYAGFYRNASGITAMSFNSYQNTSNNDTYRVSANPAGKYEIAGGHAWYVAPSGTAGNAISFTQAMTLTAGGNLLVNRTSTDGSTVLQVATKSDYGIGVQSGVTTTQYVLEFRNANGVVGTVTTSGTATAYNTSSDYRLKDNQQPLTGSGAFIDALQPKTWNWKTDGSRGVGFIAHEVQAVSPGSVVGEKDGEQMQAMEYGSAEFIANIIAELQSLRARVAQLEAK